MRYYIGIEPASVVVAREIYQKVPKTARRYAKTGHTIGSAVPDMIPNIDKMLPNRFVTPVSQTSENS